MSKKYSFEFKLKVVQEYLAGKGGSMYLAEKYNVTAHSLVQKWIAQYIYVDFGKLVTARISFSLYSLRRLQITLAIFSLLLLPDAVSSILLKMHSLFLNAELFLPTL